MMIDSYIDWFSPYKQVLTQSDEKEREKNKSRDIHFTTTYNHRLY